MKNIIFMVLFVEILMSCGFNNPFLETKLTKNSNNTDNSYDFLVNGDFELGDNYFFTEYTTPTNGSGTYIISKNPSIVHGAWAFYTDHTGSNGNMLVCDGSYDNKIVWEETIKVSQGITYTFSGWTADCRGNNSAILVIMINGSNIGSFTASSLATWTNFSYNWFSSLSTTAKIQIINNNPDQSQGNDFTVDDLSFLKN